MPAEAWVALVVGILGIVGTVIGVAWYLGGKLSNQDLKMNGMEKTIDKIEVIISAIAVDRERATSLERRVSKLELWYDELRRGVGRIDQ
jgi:hypothetical protein